MPPLATVRACRRAHLSSVLDERCTLGTVDECSFPRACPDHGARLEELADGSLRCPAQAHTVRTWLVVDLRTRAIVAAGSAKTATSGAVWLGSSLSDSWAAPDCAHAVGALCLNPPLKGFSDAR